MLPLRFKARLLLCHLMPLSRKCDCVGCFARPARNIADVSDVLECLGEKDARACDTARADAKGCVDIKKPEQV